MTCQACDTIYGVPLSRTKRDVCGAIDRLSARRNIRCNDMIRLLEGLGFAVRDGKKTGHKQVKPIYVARIRQLLVTHADRLEERKEDRDDDNGESLRLQHHGPGD